MELDLGISNTTFAPDFDAGEEFLSGKPAPEKKVEPPKKSEKEVKVEVKDKEKEVEEEPLDPWKEFEDKDDPKDKPKEEEEEVDDSKEKEKETKEEEVKEVDYEGFSDDLVKLGIFTNMEGEQKPKTPEELAARFQKEKQLGATQWLQAYLGRFGEDRQELFQAIYVDGVDPSEYIPVLNRVQDFENLDMADEANQERVVAEFYTRQGFEPTEVSKKVQKTKDYGDLKEDSESFVSKLIEGDKQVLADQEKAAQDIQKRKQAEDQHYRVAVNKLLVENINNKEFKGLPFDGDKAKKVFDFLYNKKYKVGGDELTEFDRFVIESKKPENLEKRVIIALLQLNNFDFSKIVKTAMSKEASDLFASIKKEKDKKEGQPSDKTKPQLSGKSAWDIL